MEKPVPEKRRLCSDNSIQPEVNNNKNQPEPIQNWKLLSFGGAVRIKNQTARECFAECLGTWILTVFVLSGGMQATLSQGKAGSAITGHIGAATGVLMGIMASIQISGGHINPIISVLFALRGDLRWWKLPLYFLFQHIGAFCGAAIVYGVFRDAIIEYEQNGLGETFMLWASYPLGPSTLITAIIQHVLSSGLLVLCVAALADPHNTPLPLCAVPAHIAGVVLGIACVLTLNITGILNPAIDLSSRLFSLILGYGSHTFSYLDWKWVWIPVFCPYLGAIIATYIYYLFIGIHMPSAAPKKKPTRVSDNI